MTIAAVVAGNVIDPTTFGNAVADKLNDLPASVTFGTTTASTDGSGNLTITHGHGTTPSFALVQPRSSNWSQCYVSSIGATTVTVRALSAAGANVVSTSITADWVVANQT